jgi:hypothetical protein
MEDQPGSSLDFKGVLGVHPGTRSKASESTYEPRNLG